MNAEAIFGWADKFSDRMQKEHRAREVSAGIREAEGTCGSCEKWMTGACPREVHDNRRGHKVGPSCKALKCEQFQLKAWDQGRIAALKQELSQLETELKS